jgi:hypothetical protein
MTVNGAENAHHTNEPYKKSQYQSTQNVPVFFIRKLTKLLNNPDTKLTTNQKFNSFNIQGIENQEKLNLTLDFEKTSYRRDDPTIILTLYKNTINSNGHFDQHIFKQNINEDSYKQADLLLNLIQEKLKLNQSNKQAGRTSRRTQPPSDFHQEKRNGNDRDILRYLSRKVTELKERINRLHRDNHSLREVNSKLSLENSSLRQEKKRGHESRESHTDSKTGVNSSSFLKDPVSNFGQIMKDAAQDSILPFLNLLPLIKAYKKHLKDVLGITDKHHQGRTPINEKQKDGIVKALRDLFSLPANANDIEAKKLIKDSLRQFRSQMKRISDDPHTRELLQKINPEILDRAEEISRQLNGIYDFSRGLI